jgi:hypothetical protein
MALFSPSNSFPSADGDPPWASVVLSGKHRSSQNSTLLSTRGRNQSPVIVSLVSSFVFLVLNCLPSAMETRRTRYALLSPISCTASVILHGTDHHTPTLYHSSSNAIASEPTFSDHLHECCTRLRQDRWSTRSPERPSYKYSARESGVAVFPPGF